MSRYREKIYSYYVEAWTSNVRPIALSDLNRRKPTMEMIIKEFFPKDKSAKIVDLGCGHGTLIYFAQQAGYQNISGVDTSRQQIELGQKFGIQNLKQQDIFQFLKDCPQGSLDMVTTIDVMEHLSRDEFLDFAEIVYRALKPEGRWLIHVPNGMSPYFGSVYYGDYTHEQAFTSYSLNQILSVCKFKGLRFTESRPLVYSIKGLIRFVLWKLIRSFLCVYHFVETGELFTKPILSRNIYCLALK